MRSIVIIFTIITACAVCTTSVAKEKTTPSEVATLQREMRMLKEQLRRLTAAAAKVAELNTRSAAAWNRALADNNVKSKAKTKTKTKKIKAKKAVVKARPKRVARPVEMAKKKRPPAQDSGSVGSVRGKVKVPRGAPIAYAYVENVFAPPVRGKRVVIDQKNKRFVPSWAVVRRGTKIEFPNRDNIYHNVFSPSSGNSFDLGLYNSGTPGKAHTFKAAGSAEIYCNIHPKMAANILVVPNAHFAKIKADGSFVIRNVPSGQRKIVAWSPGSTPAIQWVDLVKGKTAEVQLTLAPKSGAHKNKMGRAYGSYQ